MSHCKRRDLVAHVRQSIRGKEATEREEDFESSIRILRRLLIILGIWPMSSWKLCCSGIIWIYHFCAFTLNYILMVISTMKVDHDVAGLLMDTLMPGLQIQQDIVKYCVVHAQHESLAWLLRFMEKDWTDLGAHELTCCRDRKHARSVMTKYSRFSKILIYSFMALYTFAWVFFVQEAVSRSKYPLSIWLPFDDSRSLVYGVIVIHQTITGYFIIITVTTVDCLFITVILHLRGQFQILEFYIEDICEDSSDMLELKNKIKLIVIRHQQLIRASELAEKSFNLIVFVHTMTCMINACIQLYGCLEAIRVSNFAVLLKFIFNGLATAGQIFLFCLAGHYLTDQSSTIAIAVCRTQWYHLLPSMRRSIMLLLIRAQKPIYITARKFVPMSLGTFTGIMKTSVAYFSVLHTVAK